MNYIAPSIDDCYAQIAKELRPKMELGHLKFEIERFNITMLHLTNGIIADIGGGINISISYQITFWAVFATMTDITLSNYLQHLLNYVIPSHLRMLTSKG